MRSLSVLQPVIDEIIEHAKATYPVPSDAPPPWADAYLDITVVGADGAETSLGIVDIPARYEPMIVALLRGPLAASFVKIAGILTSQLRIDVVRAELNA